MKDVGFELIYVLRSTKDGAGLAIYTARLLGEEALVNVFFHGSTVLDIYVTGRRSRKIEKIMPGRLLHHHMVKQWEQDGPKHKDNFSILTKS